jgi:hypothetical protein
MSYIDFRAYCLNKGLNITNINKFVKILNDEDTANFDYVERIILTDKEILQLEENINCNDESKNLNKKPIETKTTKKKFIIEESDIESDNSIEMDESDNFTKDVNDIISNLLVEPVLSEDETDHINMLIKSLVDY